MKIRYKMILRKDHLFLTSAPEMKELTKPLLSFGITYFGYSRYYSNGGRLWLCNSPETLESYYTNKLYLIGNTESHPTNYQSQTVIWSTLPNQSVFHDSKQLGVDHGMFIIEPQVDSCEFFGFATTRENHRIINTYLTHMDTLKKFTNYFKEKAQRIIKQGEQSKLYLPYHNKKITVPNNPNLDCNFNWQSEDIKLSKQQRACANLLIKGMTNKQIANDLSLSQRTIEAYIDAMKIKLDCDNKSQLIVKLIKMFDSNSNL